MRKYILVFEVVVVCALLSAYPVSGQDDPLQAKNIYDGFTNRVVIFRVLMNKQLKVDVGLTSDGVYFQQAESSYYLNRQVFFWPKSTKTNNAEINRYVNGIVQAKPNLKTPYSSNDVQFARISIDLKTFESSRTNFGGNSELGDAANGLWRILHKSEFMVAKWPDELVSIKAVRDELGFDNSAPLVSYASAFDALNIQVVCFGPEMHPPSQRTNMLFAFTSLGVLMRRGFDYTYEAGYLYFVPAAKNSAMDGLLGKYFERVMKAESEVKPPYKVHEINFTRLEIENDQKGAKNVVFGHDPVLWDAVHRLSEIMGDDKYKVKEIPSGISGGEKIRDFMGLKTEK